MSARILTAITILLTMTFGLGSCSGGVDVATNLENASMAVSDSEWGTAQRLCDDVYHLLTTADSTMVSERQAGELAILYMKLSEHRNEDENIADATQALRYAYRHSEDSLRGFSLSLPLEDQRHFALLYRIGFSIDNPVDLMELDSDPHGAEESVEAGE